MQKTQFDSDNYDRCYSLKIIANGVSGINLGQLEGMKPGSMIRSTKPSLGDCWTNFSYNQPSPTKNDPRSTHFKAPKKPPKPMFSW